MSIDTLLDAIQNLGIEITSEQFEAIYVLGENWRQGVYDEGFHDGKLATKLDAKLTCQLAIDRI